MIDEDSITICHHENGSDFLLGQGSFGEVCAFPPCVPAADCQSIRENLCKTPCWPSDGALHAQVYKALRNNVQECAVKRLRNVNKTELANFQRVRNSTLLAYNCAYNAICCEPIMCLREP